MTKEFEQEVTEATENDTEMRFIAPCLKPRDLTVHNS